MPEAPRQDKRFDVPLEELKSDAAETEDGEYSFNDWQRAHHTLAICERLEAVLAELKLLRKAIESKRV